MSNTKLLKTIDWFIDIQDSLGKREYGRKFKSSIFDVEFNNINTKWQLHFEHRSKPF